MSGVHRIAPHLHAVLDGHTVVPCSLTEWSEWRQRRGLVDSSQQVAFWESNDKRRLVVSTVFLGINHGFLHDEDGARSLWFETRVFADGEVSSFHRHWAGQSRRYETWDEAACGHKAILDEVLAGLVELAETGAKEK